MKLGPHLIPNTKINSKCIKDPKFKIQNYKTSRRKRKNLHEFGFSSGVFKSRGNNKLNFIKIKSFCASKDSIMRVKDSLQNERKYCKSHI